MNNHQGGRKIRCSLADHEEPNHPLIPRLHPSQGKRRPRFFSTLPEISTSEGTLGQCQLRTICFEMSGGDQHRFYEHQQVELDNWVERVGKGAWG